MSTWFRRAIALAGVDVSPRNGFHALRRKFATELKDVPLPDLCALGGWKDAKTILTCYQAPDSGHDARGAHGETGPRDGYKPWTHPWTHPPGGAL